MHITIRDERAEDFDAIARLTEAAFRSEPHSSHTEHVIVDALRRGGGLAISLVAVEDGVIAGHVAISPVAIAPGAARWYGLGPLSVAPGRQRRGIGSMLTVAALAELRRRQAAGCVVLGDPGYYGRFGFHADARLELPGVPREYFQALSFGGDVPAGTVRYDDAFDATE